MPGNSRYFVLFAVIWMAAMTWRIYPQFKDAVRIDGHVTTVGDYVADTCGERVGPAAATCLAEARQTARQMLQREQGDSVLLIVAPLLAYLAIGLPALLWRGRRRAIAG